MAASSKGLAVPPFHLRISRSRIEQPLLPARAFGGHSPAGGAAAARRAAGVRCCCPGEKAEQWRPEPKRNGCRGGGSVARRNSAEAMSSSPLRSLRSKRLSKQLDFSSRCSTQNSASESRDTPPKRDTGIASEKEWGINLLDEKVNESGTNKDGGTWYRESGEEHGDNGYRHRWALMGGQSHDGSSKWKETWWEKSDWAGYKELGAEKSGENAEGDSWWETWKEVLYQDEWSNLARIERSAQKQAKSDTDNAEWYECWWEKYDAKGSTRKGAHKYGRLNEQSWCEKWGEYYDGRGFVHKWTDKWAEKLGMKWGDKWEEKFYGGMGSRQGETWRVSPNNERWTRTWGEQHHGHGKVHKYGHSSTGESWDTEVDEETHYETEPHYGWADVVGDSTQLLSIKHRPRPPGVYPKFNAPPAQDGPSKS